MEAMKIREHIIVLCAYLLLTVVMSWPVIANMNSSVAGSGGDVWQTLWRFENKQQALVTALDQSTFASFIKEEFIGGGQPRLVNLSVWPWMPLHVIFGEPLAYNLMWLLSFVLSGYGMYLLVTQLSAGISKSKMSFTGYWLLVTSPSFIAGVVYMFLPYHVAHAQGHFGAMQMQWLPFICAAAISLIRRPKYGLALVLALLVIVQGISEHHYLIWLTGLAIIAILFNFRQLSLLWQPHHRGKIILALVVPLASLTILYWPTIRLASNSSQLNLGREQLVRFSADMFAVIVPAPWHPWWGTPTYDLFSKTFTGNLAEAVQFVGYLPLLLILFFHYGIEKKQKTFWLLTALIFYIVSLGPQLHIFGRVTNVLLPYDLIDGWPIIGAVRTVARAGSMVGLSLAVLVGLVLNSQIRRWQNALLVLVIILVEFLFAPVVMQSTKLSAAYDRLPALSGERIIEIPAATNYRAASKALYASTKHGREVIGNIALERGADGSAALLARSLPGLRQLLYLRTTDLRQDRREFFNQELAESLTDVLKWMKVSAIIVQTDSVTPLQLSSIRTFLEGKNNLRPQLFADVILYPVDQALLPASDGIFLMRQAGWSNVGYDSDRQSFFAEIKKQAPIIIVSAYDKPVSAQIDFDIPVESSGEGFVQLAGRSIVDLRRGADRISATVLLQPGENIIQFIVRSNDKVIIQNPSLKLITANP